MARFLFLALALCIAVGESLQDDKKTACEHTFKKIGCFEEGAPNYKNLLLNDRDKIDWKNIEKYTRQLACKCDSAAKKANEGHSGSDTFVGFALHNWGECFGKTQADIDAAGLRKQSHRCTGDQSYSGCKKEHDLCLGHELADYIYLLGIAAEKGIDGGYSEWASWSGCQGVCGTGMRARERTCTNPLPEGKGKDCSGLGKSTEDEECVLAKPCPINGEYGSWGEFSKCSKPCAGGTQERTRECNSPAPEHGGKACSGPSSESRSCNTQVCPVDGKYGAWGSYSECTKSCGGGVQERNRECNNPAPAHGGKPCSGPTTESRSCNTNKCPVDGEYGPWGEFSKCSKPCAGGTQERTRECNSPAPENGGAPCSGPSSESRSCNTQKCPVNGKYGSWSKYSKCSKSCGGGVQERNRKCNKPAPAHGGKPCSGASSQTRTCNTKKCPVNGGYSSWSSYNKCSRSCGGGTQQRTRSCTNPRPANGGTGCSGTTKQTRRCNTHNCPINGGYSRWSSYSACSKSCGGGTKTRYRSCTNPSPKHGGKNCNSLGASSSTARCNTHVCLSAEYFRRTCERNKIDISCPGSSRITITHALYGRKTKSHCRGGIDWTWSTNCGAGNSHSKVRNACEGKKSCRVYAKNSVFGDPCFLTPKYLEIKYRCKG